jgi:hypothetical protein
MNVNEQLKASLKEIDDSRTKSIPIMLLTASMEHDDVVERYIVNSVSSKRSADAVHNFGSIGCVPTKRPTCRTEKPHASSVKSTDCRG